MRHLIRQLTAETWPRWWNAGNTRGRKPKSPITFAQCEWDGVAFASLTYGWQSIAPSQRGQRKSLVQPFPPPRFCSVACRGQSMSWKHKERHGTHDYGPPDPDWHAEQLVLDAMVTDATAMLAVFYGQHAGAVFSRLTAEDIEREWQNQLSEAPAAETPTAG